MARIDLHLHTRYSDGTHTPTEVVTLAHQVGVTAMAITDHDIVDGIPEAMEAGANLGLEIIPGIELTSRFEGQELHILGYCFDWQDPTLDYHLTQQRRSRHTRNQQIIDRLNECGLTLSYDEVKTQAGSDSVGRPHIARMLVDKGYVGSVQEAFHRFLADGGLASVPRQLPDTREAISWIRTAKGVPVLAHPRWTKCTGEAFYRLCSTLKDAGLLGLEALYGTHTKQETAHYLQVANQLGFLITGGSDFHGAAKSDVQVGKGRGNLKVPAALLKPLREAAL